MIQILKNERGMVLLQVMAIAAMLMIMGYVVATYNADIRRDTANKIKRYVKKDIEIIIQQNTGQAAGLIRSETVGSAETYP